jgi:hypothetical protein
MSAPAPARPKASRRDIGRLITGALVLLFGIGWLLQALGVVSLPWDVLLPVALILIGAAVVWNAGAGRRSGGLITLGILLTLALLIGSVAHIPLRGGVGDRTYRPSSFEALGAEYRLAVGDLTFGLRDLAGQQPPASKTVRVRLGVGRLTVHVGRATLIQVRAHAEVGRVSVFGRSESGFDIDVDSLPKVPAGVPVLTLDLSVGAGDLEVIGG